MAAPMGVAGISLRRLALKSDILLYSRTVWHGWPEHPLHAASLGLERDYLQLWALQMEYITDVLCKFPDTGCFEASCKAGSLGMNWLQRQASLSLCLPLQPEDLLVQTKTGRPV